MRVFLLLCLLTSCCYSKTFIVNFKDTSNLDLLNDLRVARSAKLVALRKNAQLSQSNFKKKFSQEMKLGETIWLTNSLIVEVKEREPSLLKMKSMPNVLSVEESTGVFLPRARKGKATSSLEKPLYANGVRHIGAPKIWQSFSLQGQGQLVGVIDTGIDPNHPDLIGRTALFRDFVQNIAEPYDDNGHGSHCAGSIAGGNSSGTAIGVAPQAKLIVAKGLSKFGSGDSDRILQAMQWMADPDDSPLTDDCPEVVSNSWGGQTHTYYLQAVKRWIQLGIVPVFATGNSGPGARTVLVPAGFKESLAVGAISILDDVARFSSRGPIFWDNTPLIKPDVAGPGVNIQSAKPGGGYNTYSGTSMACPHVAALAALLRQAKPDLTVGALRWLIESTCLDLGSSGKDNTFGHGRVNGFQAISKALSQQPVFGTIVDGSTGKALPANVYLDGNPLPQQVELPASTFQFFVDSGAHQLRVEKFGYQAVVIDLAPGSNESVTVELERLAHAKLSIALVNGESNAPVGGKVKVLNTPLPVFETLTGHCDFDLPLGHYDVLLMSLGYATTQKAIEVLPAGTTDTISLSSVPALLIVDDDDGAKYESYFIKALPSSLQFDRIEPHRYGQLRFEDLVAYEKVLWLTGDVSRAPISKKDEEAIERYLKSGGDIILSGQHLAQSLKFSPFLRKALATRCANSSVKSRTVKGLSLNLTIEGGDGANNQKGPDRLNSFNTGREIMHYKPIGGAACVSAFELGGTSVTLGFGLEAVSTKRGRKALMEKLLAQLPSRPIKRLKHLQQKEHRLVFIEKLNKARIPLSEKRNGRDLKRFIQFIDR